MANSEGSSGAGLPIVLSALILGAAVLGGALMIRQSLEQNAAELASLREAVAEMPSAAAPPTRRAERPRGPDPDKRYEVQTAGSPAIGPEGAPIQIVEFSDFQCPFCGRATKTLKEVEKAYGDKVRIVFKHLPLSIHPKAPDAHAASEAAHRQGKFWEMHDKIFENQREMGLAKYRVWAEELGLDLAQFDADMADKSLRAKVDADAAEAAKLQVRGTPGFFINGRFLSGAQPFAAFKRVIDEEIEEEG